MDSIISVGIGMKYDASGMKLAKNDIVQFEKLNKGLATTIRSSVTDSAKKLGVELGNTNNIVGVKLVAAFDKLGKQSGQFQKVKVYFKDINGALYEQEKILQRVADKQNRLANGRFGKGASPVFDAVGAGSIRPVGPEKVFGSPTKSVFADIDVGKLAARAALTIPTWLALRAGIMGVIDVIPNAINRFKELDSAASEMKVLTDGAENIVNFSERARNAVEKLTLTMGYSAEESKKFYTASASAGASGETAFGVMDTLATGARATVSDPAEFSKTVVLLVNNLGKTLPLATNEVERYKETIARMYQVQKITSGSMNDFAEALKQIIATGATAGSTIEDLLISVGVVSSAGRSAGPGGTAVRTALDQVVQKRVELQRELGNFTDAEFANKNLALFNVAKKLKELTESGPAGKAYAENVVSNVFGVKASQFIKSAMQMIEMYDRLRADQNSITGLGSVEKAYERVTGAAKEVTDTIKVQSDIIAESWKSIQANFVGGALGIDANDARKGTKQLADAFREAISWAKDYGEAIHTDIELLKKLWNVLPQGVIMKSFTKGLGALGEIRKQTEAKQLAAMGPVYGPEISDRQRGYSKLFTSKRAIFDSFKSRKAALAETESTSANESRIALFPEREKNLKLQIDALDKLKAYGITDIQLKSEALRLAKELYQQEEDISKIKEYQAALDKAQLARQLEITSSVQASIKDSLLGNLQGKGNNLFSDLQANFTSQIQNSMAENLSSVIMSTGIGDMFSMIPGFLNEGARKITDPVIKAHEEGGKKVYDWINKAFDQITGKQTASASGQTAGFSGSGNGLPGIWGSSAFTQGATYNVDKRPDGFVGPMNATQTNPNAGKPNFWGKAGAYGTVAAGSAITAAGGVQQMKGGGAKNIVGGLGQVGMAVGAGASGMLALGAFGGAAGAGVAGSAASMLGVLGVAGLAIGAVLMIASMFMKGAKSTQTSTQVSETKVGSKIDISNKRLELINRNLIALKNTMESYALSTSSYFSEKNGTIDSQFALSARRSYA